MFWSVLTVEWCIAVGSTGMGIKTRSTQSSRQRINMSGQRYMYMYILYCVYTCPTRGSSFFCLGCAVLLCLVCLTLLVSFFLPSHLSLKTCIRTCRGFESHLRQLIFSRKSDCLGCAVLLCLVCLFDLACFFLSFFLLISHLKTCT